MRWVTAFEPMSVALSLWSEVNDTNHTATEAPESNGDITEIIKVGLIQNHYLQFTPI